MILHALDLSICMPTHSRKPLATFSSPGFTRHNIVPNCAMHHPELLHLLSLLRSPSFTCLSFLDHTSLPFRSCFKHEPLCYCCSVTKSCPTLCDPMGRSTPGLSVPHHLLEFTQVHVHCIGDAIQSSHPLMPTSPSALNLSQHEGLSCHNSRGCEYPK